MGAKPGGAVGAVPAVPAGPRARTAAGVREHGLLRRDGGFLAVEPVEGGGAVGFVRYTLLRFPDGDVPQPEIGIGLDPSARCKGYAGEACGLLVGYLFDGYPVERVSALTDAENAPCQRMLERLGFRCEGVMRRATFRDGRWCDLALYGQLRSEWKERGA